MQVTIDPYDRRTAYADLRDGEPLTDALRARGAGRGRELGATVVEFWQAPYGRGPDRMAGFVELLRLPGGAAAMPPPAELTETAVGRKLA